jgi:acyl carrier protein
MKVAAMRVVAISAGILALEGEMDTKEDILTCLQQIIDDHLEVKHEEVTENSTWAELGADSLDRLQISLSIENALGIEIPHSIGERSRPQKTTLTCE